MRIFFIALTALTFFSCKELEILKYEYHTTTMMGRTVLSVTEDSVTVSFNGRGEPTYFSRATQSTEWNALNKSMAEVDLSKVNSLEAPTNKRATDGAAYAKFIFVGKDSTLRSADFDGGNPHDMLQPLMKEILKIQEKNKN